MNTETFERLLKQAVPDGKTIREIRIRTEKPVMILLESGENSENGVTLQRFPYEQMALYVKKINQNYETYRRLYS